MTCAMIRINGFVWVTLSSLCVVSIGPIRAQGIPGRSPNAKACAYLPIAELEAHYGAKANNVGGMDLDTVNSCSASFPDVLHGVFLESFTPSHPSSAVDLAMTAAQRIAFVKQTMGKDLLDTRDFGSVGCFQSTVRLAKPVRDTTCFLAKARYLRLSLQSVDPAQVSFETTKSLLEKAAARRK